MVRRVGRPLEGSVDLAFMVGTLMFCIEKGSIERKDNIFILNIRLIMEPNSIIILKEGDVVPPSIQGRGIKKFCVSIPLHKLVDP